MVRWCFVAFCGFHSKLSLEDWRITLETLLLRCNQHYFHRFPLTSLVLLPPSSYLPFNSLWRVSQPDLYSGLAEIWESHGNRGHRRPRVGPCSFDTESTSTTTPRPHHELYYPEVICIASSNGPRCNNQRPCITYLSISSYDELLLPTYHERYLQPGKLGRLKSCPFRWRQRTCMLSVRTS